MLDQAYTPEEIAEQGTYSSVQLQNWHYLGGYERQFQDSNPSNPAQVSSNAGAYGTMDGIAKAFAENQALCNENGFRIVSSNEGLGDQSLLCTKDTQIQGQEARVYFVIWRKKLIKSSITTTQLVSQSNQSLALHLAGKQNANY